MGADGLPGYRDVVSEMVNYACHRNRIAVCLLNRTESAIPCYMARPNPTHEGRRAYSRIWFFVERLTMLRNWGRGRIDSREGSEGRQDAAIWDWIDYLMSEGGLPEKTR